eukprot:TRINITY_DN818_c0_g5_i1.p1 TRINITY_DN818_c0_g5~~TRINITY_DN818_c0_g5_i1.p1  ORF type:complete len:108 (+),score=1.74 TRINITY_DN818_c0_g5_i1:717-1040(+)
MANALNVPPPMQICPETDSVLRTVPPRKTHAFCSQRQCSALCSRVAKLHGDVHSEGVGCALTPQHIRHLREGNPPFHHHYCAVSNPDSQQFIQRTLATAHQHHNRQR